MNRPTVVLAACLLLFAASEKAQAQILSYTLLADSAAPDVLFDPGLGTLTSISLEFRFQAGVVYENQLTEELGTMSPFDLTFFGEAPFYIDNAMTSRNSAYSWSLPGHGDGGSTSPYYWASSTGPLVQTYTDQNTLDFFTLQEGDQGLFYHPNPGEWILCSPEVIYDSRFSRYDAYYANVQLGDGIVITYNYEAMTPVPEPQSALLAGVAAALLLAFRLRTRRRAA